MLNLNRLSMLVPTLLLLVTGLTDARYLQEMKHGFVIPCEGELCLQTLFCWKGARFADLNQVASRVTATVNFSDEHDTCVEAESDDVLSLRSLAFGYNNETAAIRLSERIGHERGWLSSLILKALVGDHKSTGDGVCNGKQCTIQTSPYGQSCIRLCSKPPTDGRIMKAEVFFKSENAIDLSALYLWFLGFALAAAAPSLSQRPEMFYLTGGSLGVMFAVALLVLIVSRMATRSGPTKSQLGVAAVFQVGVVYMRKAVYDFVKSYIDWIALYVVVTFVASLALVHYFLKGEDGRIHLSSSLKDIVRTALQLLAAFLIAAPIPSARFRIITIALVLATEVASSLSKGALATRFIGTPVKKVRGDGGHEYEDTGVVQEEIFYNPASARTPMRGETSQSAKNYSGSRFLTEDEYEALGREYTDRELRKLFTPSKSSTKKEKEMLDWIRENHNKLFVRKDDGEGEPEEEEEEEFTDSADE